MNLIVRKTRIPKTVAREGRQEGGFKEKDAMQNSSVSADRLAKQEAEAKAKREKLEKHAEASIWTPRMLDTLAKGVKGGKWFSLIDKVYHENTLRLAWEKVKANKGASGIDKMSIKKFDEHADRYLQEMAKSLKENRYKANAVRRVEINKGNGKTRPLGIPTIKDRIVQMAVKMVIEPIFEANFRPTSYGFRPGRSAKGAREHVEQFLKMGYVHVVDADLKSYFDTIPHDRLMDRIKESISDGRILALLEDWLKQDIVSEVARWTPSRGTPQGAVISPLLANIYLDYLDKHLYSKGYFSIRYADDFVVLCISEFDAKRALNEVEQWATENGLSLSPEKTHIGNFRVSGKGFDFLGYHYERNNCDVRKKSLDSFKDKLRGLTPRRSCGDAIKKVVASLNSRLRGWFNYFKDGKRRTFITLDRMVRRRLRAILLSYNKKRGMGISIKSHKRWPNSFFDDLGLFNMAKAHRAVARS